MLSAYRKVSGTEVTSFLYFSGAVKSNENGYIREHCGQWKGKVHCFESHSQPERSAVTGQALVMLTRCDASPHIE